MIYLNKNIKDSSNFELLLGLIKTETTKALGNIALPSGLTGNEFESLVFESGNIASKETLFDGQLVHTDDRDFPDIIAAGLYGIEVKATKKDDWTSIGNSVLESSRIKSVEKIYLFFGKLGGSPEIRYRNYEDCLKGIAVTHYPRYQIDMKLEEGASIFSKMGTTYDLMRLSENPIKGIRDYYKAQLRDGDGLWWIGDDIEKTGNINPIIRNFKSLDRRQQDIIKSDIFIKFPEILSRSSLKYEKIPAYLAARYGVVSSNIRDQFSASGRVKVQYKKFKFEVPRAVSELFRLSSLINSQLLEEAKNRSDLRSEMYENIVVNKENWISSVEVFFSELNVPFSFKEVFDDVSKKDFIDITKFFSA